ncbi:MAG: ABC transporter substrate-binding protein [Clostridiales bacterium]|nr:ABC transporter substrate-binding protein [Clostridiales bacterium]
MKKFTVVFLLSLLVVTLGGCATNNKDGGKEKNSVTDDSKQDDKEVKKIVVGASITPHAEILEVAKGVLATKGYELEIKEYNDYVQPNLALDFGDLDANFFQHQPYLDEFNESRNLNLVSVAIVHYEPFAIYPGKTKTFEELQDGAQIAVPNDGTNEARALLLLEAQGLIKLAEGVGLSATVIDIVENPKNLEIHEIEAAQLVRSLNDVDMAVINGNYAIQGDLNVAKDAIAVEEKDSEAAEIYGNVIAVRSGDEDREEIKALVEAVTSEEVKAFIESTYEGAVVPKF